MAASRHDRISTPKRIGQTNRLLGSGLHIALYTDIGQEFAPSSVVRIRVAVNGQSACIKLLR